MNDSSAEKKQSNLILRAGFAGFIAGIFAGFICFSLLGLGILGLVLGFIAGAIVGSRTVLLMERAKELKQ